MTRILKYNIIHVITTLDRGGAENHLVELINGQLMAGHQISVAYLKGNGYWKRRLEGWGVSVIDLEMAYYGHLSPIFKLRRALRKKCPDLVHAHLPPAELYARLALAGLDRKRFPMVISKHLDGPFMNTLRLNVAPVSNWISRRCEGIIAISDAVGEYFHRTRLNLPRLGISVIHYGLTVSIGSRSQENVRTVREWKPDPSGLVFGAVARLVPQKGLDTLLLAFARIVSEAGPGNRSRLIIVGSGPLEHELRALADSLGIGNSVAWAGFREDIPDVMASFDVFVLSSLYEGFGLVLLEAMAASRPIVASRVSAIPEIVLDGETGFLVPPGDSEALAGAMRRMFDPSLRDKMGRKGLMRLGTTFSTEKMVKSTLELYRKIIEEKSTDEAQDGITGRRRIERAK